MVHSIKRSQRLYIRSIRIYIKGPYIVKVTLATSGLNVAEKATSMTIATNMATPAFKATLVNAIPVTVSATVPANLYNIIVIV